MRRNTTNAAIATSDRVITDCQPRCDMTGVDREEIEKEIGQLTQKTGANLERGNRGEVGEQCHVDEGKDRPAP